MLALVALALLVQPDTTFRPAAPPEAPRDTVETVEEAIEDVTEDVTEDVVRARVRPVFSPSSLYSSSKGFGVRGGVAADGVLSPGDHVQVEARISQRLQGGFAEYLTAEPGVGRWALGLGGAAWTTTRTRFSGHGPHSTDGGDLWLDRLAAEAEARLTWAPAGPRGVLLQPSARFRFDRVRGFEERRAGALALVQPGDLGRIEALAGTDRYGVELALAAVRDTRDRPARPSRGAYVQGEVGRFQSLDGSGLGVWRAEALGYGFRPALLQLPFLPERGALFVRANGVVTRQDGGGPLPWVYLSELNRDLLVGYPRSGFVGRDALSVGVGARGVIGEAIGAFLVEGTAMAMVGAAYDDVFREFTPRVRFSNARSPVGEAVPLSPSVAVGLHYIERERPLVGALVGVGPGGVSFASLRLVYGLGDYKPRLR